MEDNLKILKVEFLSNRLNLSLYNQINILQILHI